MITFNTVEEYDTFVEETIEKAKKEFPGYEKYELTEKGTLYFFSLGAYPSMVKNYSEEFTIR